MYQVCYTRYQVLPYFWRTGPVVKHCKTPKYYEQDFGFKDSKKVSEMIEA